MPPRIAKLNLRYLGFELVLALKCTFIFVEYALELVRIRHIVALASYVFAGARQTTKLSRLVPRFLDYSSNCDSTFLPKHRHYSNTFSRSTIRENITARFFSSHGVCCLSKSHVSFVMARSGIAFILPSIGIFALTFVFQARLLQENIGSRRKNAAFSFRA